MVRSPRFGAALAVALLAATIARAAPPAAAPALTSGSGGKVRAVVVGIDRYDNEPTLHGAEADAADLADALRRGGATVLAEDGAPFAKGPTRAVLVRLLDRLVADSRPGDLAVITYSGHGARVPEYDLPGWHGLEPGGMNEEFVLGGYAPAGAGLSEVIVNKEMKAWLARLDAKGVDALLIADTCFGGGAVRGFDPLSDTLVMRGEPKPLARPPAGRFTPIPMSAKELRTEVTDLSRVTFLAGADQLHQVPEVRIPGGGGGTRGALSYAVARALRGELGAGPDGLVTRKALFDASLQIVSQYTDDRQLIDLEPKAAAPGAVDRPLFRLSAAAPPAPAPVAPGLTLAFAGGDGAEVLAHRDGARPFTVVGRDAADLVWDLARREVSSHGDVIRRDAVPEDLRGLLDRTTAIARLKTLSEARLLGIQLENGGRSYRPGDEKPNFQVSDAAGRDLVVFNVASNGLVQMLSPARTEPAAVTAPRWSYAPRVTEPFGADQVVAVQGPRGSLDALAAWLWRFDNQPAAAQLPDRLKDLLDADPSVRLGTVDLVTAP